MAIRSFFIFSALLLFTACSGPGRLLTWRVTPFTTDFDATPVGARCCEIGEYHLQEPFTQARVAVDWTSEVIRQAMAEAGMTTAYYIDKKEFSLWGGVYRKSTLVVCGD